MCMLVDVRVSSTAHPRHTVGLCADVMVTASSYEKFSGVLWFGRNWQRNPWMCTQQCQVCVWWCVFQWKLWALCSLPLVCKWESRQVWWISKWWARCRHLRKRPIANLRKSESVNSTAKSLAAKKNMKRQWDIVCYIAPFHTHCSIKKPSS